MRRSIKECQPSNKYSPHEYIMLIDGREPESYLEALKIEYKDEWLNAMQEEMNSLHKNCTYDLI